MLLVERSGFGLNELLGRSQCTDHDVVPVRITQCELSGACVWIDIRLLFKRRDKAARAAQRLVKVIYAKEEK